MKNTRLTLLEQLRITEREIRRRQELIGLTDENIAILLESRPLISQNIDVIVDDFYGDQVQEPEIARLIGDSETLSRLKKYMRKYILDLFDGLYDTEYVQSRLRIGMVHKRIGVTPKLYISAVHNLQNLLKKHLAGESGEDCESCIRRMDALEKIILFDLALVFDTYIHSLMEEVGRSKEELEKYAQSLEETIALRTHELAELARVDSLTSLFNQRSFYEELKRELSRAQRNADTISLIYFDLDGFKAVNDTMGHRKGDEILVKTADAIRSSVRPSDVAARYGGDEFCIILPQTEISDAIGICKRIIENFESRGQTSGVTFSFGISENNSQNLYDVDLFVKKADTAMYISKKRPGHQISTSSSE